MNLLSSHKMSRSGHKWSQDEILNMISLYESGVTLGEIATMLHRPLGDITVKIKTIGILNIDPKFNVSQISSIRKE